MPDLPEIWMDPIEYEKLENYLKLQSYPVDSNKNAKRLLRKKASGSFPRVITVDKLPDILRESTTIIVINVSVTRMLLLRRGTIGLRCTPRYKTTYRIAFDVKRTNPA